MKRLHWFMIRSFLGPFFMTFCICVFVLLMQFLWKYVDDLVGKGLEWNVITELLFYAAFALIPMAFPLATLIASIMTFGNLGENYELVAMKASGISLFRIMRPLLVVAILLTLTAFYFANNILPKSQMKFQALLSSVKQKKPEMVIKEGVFTNDLPNYSIKVDRKSKETNMLYGLMIYDHTDRDGKVSVILADSGKMEVTANRGYMQITLYDGNSYQDLKENVRLSERRFPFQRVSFKKQVINVSMKDFEFNRNDENRFKQYSKMMNISQLSTHADSAFQQYKMRLWRFVNSMSYGADINSQVSWYSMPFDSLRKEKPIVKPDTIVDFDKVIASLNTFDKEYLHQNAIEYARANKQAVNQQNEDMYLFKRSTNNYFMEWHRKFTWSFACLIFFFIGAPLGAIIRKGGLGMPVVVSILMFIAYYIIAITGEKFAREDAWTMMEGMWLSSAVFLPIGVWLTYKAATDSSVMDVESYQKIFGKIIRLNLFRRQKTEK